MWATGRIHALPPRVADLRPRPDHWICAVSGRAQRSPENRLAAESQVDLAPGRWFEKIRGKEPLEVIESRGEARAVVGAELDHESAVGTAQGPARGLAGCRRRVRARDLERAAFEFPFP